MSAIKKAFQPIMDILTAALEAGTVDQGVFDEVQAVCVAKTGNGGGKASTFHRDPETGEVVAIKCYYFGKWMDPKVVDFGEKKTSASGFNSMCKEGNNLWTKQNNEAKKATAAILDRVESGELQPADIPAEKEAIEAARTAVQPLEREDGYTGFDTLEECLAAQA